MGDILVEGPALLMPTDEFTDQGLNKAHSNPKGKKPKGYAKRRGTQIGLRPVGGGKEKKKSVPKQGKGLKKYPYGNQAVYPILPRKSR
jgi:hypothetical protein